VKPVLVDLFCKAGGATKGYQRAGFYVVGVDIEPQPHYCGDEFFQADALTFPLGEAEAVHASPPCQRWTAYGRRPAHVGAHPDLIEAVRDRLRRTGGPYVIENIPGAPLLSPVQLCGSAFGLDVQRHRGFETSFPMMVPPCNHGVWTARFPHATNRTQLRRTVEVGVWRIPLPVQQRAMGVDWMTLEELSEAIPPAFTEFVGEQLMTFLKHRDAGCVNTREGSE
jgi:DNA (cytosine-5)-methyltransferase 1